MDLNKQDWQKLKIPLVVLAVVMITVASMFGIAQYYSTMQAQALQAQQNSVRAALQRYLSSGAEKETIVEFLPKYQALIDKGFVGEERRIEWVEDLRTQHDAHKLFGVKYSISPQERYTAAFATNLGGFVLNRSTMKLELDMLHEGDLLKLTESLGANGKAFMLRDCEITRINTGATLNYHLIANLHAQCELDWLTLREPEPAPIQVP